MKIIIISSLSLLSQVVISQPQQQHVFINNNPSNLNLLNNRASMRNNNVSTNIQNFNNINIQISNNVVSRPQIIRNPARVRSSRRYVRFSNSNTINAPVVQARRRVRSRTTPVNQTNVPITQVLTASNSNPAVISNILPNPSVQNFVLINNDDAVVQNGSKIQSQGGNPYNQINTSDFGAQSIANTDVSGNFKNTSASKVKVISSYAGSSSRSKSHIFSKKFAKFKRHFFGKLSSRKKGNHHIDLCFNWKN